MPIPAHTDMPIWYAKSLRQGLAAQPHVPPPALTPLVGVHHVPLPARVPSPSLPAVPLSMSTMSLSPSHSPPFPLCSPCLPCPHRVKVHHVIAWQRSPCPNLQKPPGRPSIPCCPPTLSMSTTYLPSGCTLTSTLFLPMSWGGEGREGEGKVGRGGRDKGQGAREAVSGLARQARR